ncbi:ribose-phosphate diphosphokinase [Breznakiella homolactica]|uniref:Ribose-phosphate pyrophosphokinase n=1 Tax=Breznakiella homolactica TaxID=2798577 RepID=A0A7T7XKP0_9SPIR|nr:ribose-phosphate diphosphokinase [Breznakiella homolactica]QQO08169.1 ribose-phosphate diphosphokinase [Breznakiella homolactica]
MDNQFAVTATRSMMGYASQVARHLKKFPSFSSLEEEIDCVNSLETDRFADGEMEVVVNSSLRGKDVYLFTSCARNEAGISVEEAKIELYNAVDALKRSQANRIIVFEPFVSSSRSDRTIRRSSVGLWVHMKILTSLGTDHILTYQLHSDKSKSMLDPTICFMDDLPALTLLKKRLCDVYIRDLETLENVVRKNWAFCSVDAGGEKLARKFANSFGAPLVVAHKQRDYSKANTIESINILSAEPISGKVIWIVDDMVDTGGSVESLIRTLADHKPAEINIIAVHAILSDPASERLLKLSSEGLLNRVMVTDTVYCPECLPTELPNLEVVPSVELSARIIGTIVTNRPMGKLLEVFNAEKYLRSPRLL